MWYDKYPGTPPRGSPLETLFVLVQLQRREADLLATKAQVLGSMADSNEETKNVIASFKGYCDAMFPFLEAAGKMDEAKLKERLFEHSKQVLRIDVAGIRKDRAAEAKRKGIDKYKLRKFAEVEIPGIKR